MKSDKLCFYCAIKMTPPSKSGKVLPTTRTQDHVIPRSRGGNGIHGNKVWACSKCNAEKKNMSMEDFRALIMFRKGLLVPINGELHVFPGERDLKFKPLFQKANTLKQLRRQWRHRWNNYKTILVGLYRSGKVILSEFEDNTNSVSVEGD